MFCTVHCHVSSNKTPTECTCLMYKVVKIWPGQTVTCLDTNRPGHIWTTLYFTSRTYMFHHSPSDTHTNTQGISDILTNVNFNIFNTTHTLPSHYRYLYTGLAHLDNNVFCNRRHPEDGLMGPKHVCASSKIHNTCEFCWCFIWWYPFQTSSKLYCFW